MTTEEKAQAYDEALSRAKHFLTNIGVPSDEDAIDAVKRMSEYIFPELAESEDERIRKELISMIKLALEDGSALCPSGMTTKEDAIAWLEKQGEKKPAEWSEGDRQMFRNCEDAIRLAKYGRKISADYDEMCSWLKSLRPQKQWKPSDAMLQSLQFVIEYHAFANPVNRDNITRLYNDLKQL